MRGCSVVALGIVWAGSDADVPHCVGGRALHCSRRPPQGCHQQVWLWRMPEKKVSVKLVRWASEVTALNPRMGGRPLDIGGRSLSVTDLVNTAEEDVWSSAERRWRHLARQDSPPNEGYPEPVLPI